MYEIFRSYHKFIFTDIDECLDNNGGCNEQCVNTDESYHCTCKTGYKLKDDKKTCVGKFIPLFSSSMLKDPADPTFLTFLRNLIQLKL